MVSERDRLVKIIQYLQGLDIEINYKKNKARGKRGFFRVQDEKVRIDIAKELTDLESLSVIIHEFAHYVHYKQDKTLKTLDFISTNLNDTHWEELITLTVELIPKKTIEPLFEIKEKLHNEINNLRKNKFNIISNIAMQSKQKILNRINSRISRLNKYYNSPTELFARSMEIYILDYNKFKKKAPNLTYIYDDIVKNNKIPSLTDFVNTMLN